MIYCFIVLSIQIELKSSFYIQNW